MKLFSHSLLFVSIFFFFNRAGFAVTDLVIKSDSGDKEITVKWNSHAWFEIENEASTQFGAAGALRLDDEGSSHLNENNSVTGPDGKLVPISRVVLNQKIIEKISGHVFFVAEKID